MHWYLMNLTLKSEKPRIFVFDVSNISNCFAHAIALPSRPVRSFDQLGRNRCSGGPAGSIGSCDLPWVPEIHFAKSCQPVIISLQCTCCLL